MNRAVDIRGRQIRAALSKVMVPRLVVGEPVPSCRQLARALGLSYVAAYRYRKRVLDEAGIVLRKNEDNTLIVAALPR